MVGASGAVMAVVVLYALYYPHREVLLFFILPVEMWLLVVVFLGYRRSGSCSTAASTGEVAVASHLRGRRYGYLFKQFDLRWSRLSWSRMRRPRLRIVIARAAREAAPPAPPSGPTWSPEPGHRAEALDRPPSSPRSSSTPGSTRSSPRSPARAARA